MATSDTPSPTTVARALADRIVYALAEQGIMTTSPLAPAAGFAVIGSVSKVDPGFAEVLAAELPRRQMEYINGAPWHRWPLKAHGQRLTLFLAGIEASEQREAMIRRYSADIEAEMVDAGHCIEVARSWVGKLVRETEEAGLRLRMAGGSMVGSA